MISWILSILSDSSYEKSSGEVSGGLGERRGSVPVVSSIGRDDDSVTMEPPQTPSTPSRLAVSTLSIHSLIIVLVGLIRSLQYTTDPTQHLPSKPVEQVLDIAQEHLPQQDSMDYIAWWQFYDYWPRSWERMYLVASICSSICRFVCALY